MIMSCPKQRGGLTNLTQTDEHLISISWFSGGALPGWQHMMPSRSLLILQAINAAVLIWAQSSIKQIVCYGTGKQLACTSAGKCLQKFRDGVHVRKHFQDSYEGFSLQCSVVTSKQDKSVIYHTFYL